MEKKRAISEKCILGLLILLTVAAAVVKLFVGFDIDEGYAVTMPQRLVSGEHLFLDLWEVHQTSSFLPALFMAGYEALTHGTDGIVLYLRIVATVIHLFVSLLVYRACPKRFGRLRVLLALLYFNFLPKWIMSPDFSMQQVWGMTLMLYFLHLTVTKGRLGHAFCTGLSLAFTVLAYPGMVVLYPVVLACVFCLGDGSEKEPGGKSVAAAGRWRCCGMLTLGCILPAVCFFGYVLIYMSPGRLWESIPLIFMDGTHQFTAAMKFAAYFAQWKNVGKQLVIMGIPSIIITTVIKTVFRAQTKETGTGVVFLWSWTVVTSLLVVLANVIGLRIGPFHFQVRYLGFAVGCAVVGYKRRDRFPALFWEGFVCNLAAFLGILLFSNVGPDASSSYLIIAVILGFAMLHELTYKNNTSNLFTYLGCSVFVLSLIFCKGYYVRITEYGPSNILQPRVQMADGPLKGLYLLPEDQKRAAEDRMTVQAAASQEEKLLFLGTEGILNLSAKGAFVSPSTISTPAFNEQWTLYFTMYPEKQPDVIVIAKNTIDDREKFFAKNPFGMWIAQNYDTMHKEETDSLCVIRRGGAGR